MTDELDVSTECGVTTLTLDRPAKLNAITPNMDRTLAVTLHRLADDPACRAILLRGAGEGAFSAGADIAEGSFPDGFRVGADWNPHLGAQAARALSEFPKPSVAAVHAYCLGGAAELILLADFRIASHDALFAFPEVDLGMTPGWGASQMLPRIVGRAHALDLLLTGRRVSGDEAVSIGLVNRVVDRDDLLAEGRQLADSLAAKPTTAVRLVKRAVNLAGVLSINDGMRFERDLVAYRFATAEPGGDGR